MQDMDMTGEVGLKGLDTILDFAVAKAATQKRQREQYEQN